MDPDMLFGLLGPANNFVMGGLPIHLAKVLLIEGKPLPKELFVEVIVEKTQILIERVKNHHLGLCLTANINGNSAIIRIYDNFHNCEHPSITNNPIKSPRFRGTIISPICRSYWHNP